MRKLISFILLGLLIISACEKRAENEANSFSPEVIKETQKVPEELAKAIKSVEPFFKPMGNPSPDEWLARFKEDGQTFDQYINSNPTLPTQERKIIYIQPIGKFNPEQQKVIKLTAEYMQSYFGLPVKMLQIKKFNEPLSLENYRINQFSKNKQIRTGFVMDNLLRPNLPKDAAALIAFTNEDLYPGKSFNFVFGQASLENRVGVWSLYRFNDEHIFNKFLVRTIKIAVHETGHMFSIAHCTKYECVMSGCNHLGETDKHPIDACPECMAKICWFSKIEPKKRYEKLADFCEINGLSIEASEFREKVKAVS
jgi:archaemetzincin